MNERPVTPKMSRGARDGPSRFQPELTCLLRVFVESNPMLL
jgi:hypothetical protein